MAKKKNETGKVLMAVGGGMVGGVVGNQITTMIENAMIKAQNKNASTLSPIFTGAIGVAVAMFASDEIKPVGIGMSSVAGTEVVEGLISKMNKPKVPTTTTDEPTQGANIRSMGGNVDSSNTRMEAGEDMYIQQPYV